MANPLITNTNQIFRLHHAFNQRLLKIKNIYIIDCYVSLN